MTITLTQIVVWIVVGALAGSLAGSVVTGKWEGLGRWTSLGIGLVGALIGGAIFRLFGIWPGLEVFDFASRCGGGHYWLAHFPRSALVRP
ncbi:MAG: GlsB/YeaQ/YmgE family stress response membrane protein [Mesorhizobium sp.]|jgi:uncharacterized membrane protein YeaQ/YmgE (transglycosylase-associated protein family)